MSIVFSISTRHARKAERLILSTEGTYHEVRPSEIFRKKSSNLSNKLKISLANASVYRESERDAEDTVEPNSMDFGDASLTVLCSDKESDLTICNASQ